MKIYGIEWEKEDRGLLLKQGKWYRLCHICNRVFVDVHATEYLACANCYLKCSDSPEAREYMEAFKKMWLKKMNNGEFDEK